MKNIDAGLDDPFSMVAERGVTHCMCDKNNNTRESRQLAPARSNVRRAAKQKQTDTPSAPYKILQLHTKSTHLKNMITKPRAMHELANETILGCDLRIVEIDNAMLRPASSG